MIEYTTGQIVFSKCGHDKGKAYVIVSVEGEYLYLTDGENRTVDKTKKKKCKHVQATDYVEKELKALIDEGKVLDSDVRKALKPYKNKFLCGSKEV